jgi:hypothetical protein
MAAESCGFESRLDAMNDATVLGRMVVLEEAEPSSVATFRAISCWDLTQG